MNPSPIFQWSLATRLNHFGPRTMMIRLYVFGSKGPQYDEPGAYQFGLFQDGLPSPEPIIFHDGLDVSQPTSAGVDWLQALQSRRMNDGLQAAQPMEFHNGLDVSRSRAHDVGASEASLSRAPPICQARAVLAKPLAPTRPRWQTWQQLRTWHGVSGTREGTIPTCYPMKIELFVV